LSGNGIKLFLISRLSSSVNAAAVNLSAKVDAPVDTSIRAKHASNLFRPPIITA